MKRAPLLFALLGISLLSGCVGFQQKWQRAQVAFPAPQKTIEGAWIGSWKSGANGHGGKLRCVVTRIAPERYEFYYWATWARVISAGFRIECEVKKKAGEWTFAGEKDLGALGGKFDHIGSATPLKLDATFSGAGGDHGSFEMKRVQ